MEINVNTIEDLDALSAKAETAVSTGDWATAATGYEALIRRCPEQVQLKYKLARAYGELGRRQEVIELLNGPSEAGLVKAKRMLAVTYIEAKNYAAAMPLVDELIAASPNDPKLGKWKSLCVAKTSADRRLVEWLQEGQALFSADRLEEAEQVYLELLTEYPNTERAYFRLGQIYSLQRRWADAIEPLRAGLAIDPDHIKMRKSLAKALLKQGEPAEAIAVLDRLDERENDPDVLILLQDCHVRLRDWPRVDDLGTRLLAIVSPEDPRHALVSSIRQNALVEIEAAGIDAVAESGDFDRAISGYADIADRYPESAQAWLKLGTALADADRHADAAKALRNALRFRPGDMKIRKALTRAVIETAEEHEVLRYVQDAIAGDTADPECHRWLARYHANHYDWPSALESARNALAIDPKHASSRLLVIRTLMHLARLPEALDELDVLISLKAKQVPLLQLKADIFVRLARLDDAIDLYRTALRADPKHPLISHRLSCALLLKGDIAGFHRFHEKRRGIRTFIQNNKDYPFRDWNGELSIEGKLLVWSEFGLGVGQNILHMTFLRSLASLGLDVVFEVEPRLVDICRRSFPEVTVVANDAELPAGISHHTPIGSLSRWFKPDLASFESVQPFFVPDVRAVAAHRDRLQRAAGERHLLIGISWTSNNPFVGDVKSVPLEQLLDAIALPGITLVNLQYGDHSQSIAQAEAKTGKRMLDSGINNTNDLDGLSAVVAAMDLVVCIGHTTAHMAGAVGTPNFVMLPAAPFAHWLAQGERCIWYPATTLFRQAPIDDGWKVVLDQVGRALRDFADGYDPESWLATTLVQGLRPLPAQAETMSPRDICDAVSSFAAQGAYRSARELISRLPSDHLSRELHVQRGHLLARMGDWEEARAVFVSLQTDEGRDRAIDKQIVSVSLAMHDLEYALPIARHLADEEAAYRLVVANILYRLRRYEEALTELRAVSVETPQMEGLSTLFGTLLIEVNEFERAERYLADQAAMRRRMEDYTLLGRSISAQGRHEEALTFFERGFTRSKNDPAGNFWRTQERVECGAVPLVPLPPLLGDIPTVEPNDVVIFFVADNTYFWQHALVLLGSLGRRSPSVKCHVHVINPDPRVARALEIVGRMLPDLGLSYSYEQADFEGCSKVHICTYYASIRFVRLAEIFAQSPAVYLCLDADCIVRDDVAARASGLKIADVGVRMRYDEKLHMTVAAGALMLRPTAAAAKFIDRVSTLIRRTLEAREAVWFLDQIVLSHVLRDLGDGEVGVSQLDMTYIDWFFHDHSVIWTGKGKRKSEDSRYIGELSQYRYLQENEEIADLMHQISEETAKA